MSIDYDRLRKLADEHTPGPWQCDVFEDGPEVYVETADHSIVADTTDAADGRLIALAPDMARELLALRDGVKQVADDLGANAEYAPNIPAQTAYTEAERLLTDLLEGHTE